MEFNYDRTGMSFTAVNKQEVDVLKKLYELIPEEFKTMDKPINHNETDDLVWFSYDDVNAARLYFAAYDFQDVIKNA